MSIVEKLRDIEGVKNVEKRRSEIRIDPFKRPVEGSEASKIIGDLSSMTQSIRHILDEEFESWEWIVRPKKRYSELEIGNVTDRKPKGHRPDYYTVSIE